MTGLLLAAWAWAAPLTPPRPLAPIDVPAPVTLGAPLLVELELRIDASGRVVAVEVVSGPPEWVERVVAAVRETPFFPATEEGEPVEVVVPFRWTAEPEPIDVAGVVRVAGSRRLAADVALAVGPRTVRTDAEGRFSVRGLADGPVEVRLLEPSFRMDPVAIELAPDERVDLELWLVEERWSSEVVGVYRRSPEVTIRRSLSHDAIREAPGGLGDPVRALQNVPGLTRTPLDAGWLLVRGGNPEDTPVFLDGVRLPSLYHLGGLTSVLHPEMVERIDLYPGAPPARLSRGLSGAAEMTSRRLAGDTRAVGGVNLAFAHLFAEAPLGEHGGVAIAGRRSYLDAVLTAVLGPERARIAPRFWDVQARVDTPAAGLFLVGVWDEASFPAEEGTDLDDAGQRSLQAQGRVSGRVGAVDVELRPWLSVSDTTISGFREEATRDLSPGGRLEAWGAAGGVRWRLGAEAAHHAWTITRDGEGRGGATTSIDPYAELAGGGDLRARLGLRLDTLLVPGHLPRAGLSPRGDVRWTLSRRVALTAAAWRSHQEPPRTFLLGYPDGPYLHLERATGASAGLKLGGAGAGLDLELWTRVLDDVTGLERDGTLGRYRGLARGVEAAAWVDGDRGSAQLIAQLGETREAAEPGDALSPTRFDQPLRINTTATWRLPRDWSLGGRWRFSSGLPSPPGGVTAYDVLRQQTRTTVASDRGRLPPYHALDLRVSRRITLRKWRLDAFLDVQNAYWRRIAEPAINGIDETLLVYGYGLPILPLFGVDATFWPGRPEGAEGAEG